MQVHKKIEEYMENKHLKRNQGKLQISVDGKCVKKEMSPAFDEQLKNKSINVYVVYIQPGNTVLCLS